MFQSLSVDWKLKEGECLLTGRHVHIVDYRSTHAVCHFFIIIFSVIAV